MTDVERLQNAIKPFAEYFQRQEKLMADRGGNPAAMPETKKLHSIAVAEWRAAVAALS